MYCYYATQKYKNGYRKRVTWLETQPAGDKSLAVTEYIGECIVELRHGNVRGNTTPCNDDCSAKNAAPKVVYTDMVPDMEVNDAPRNSCVISNKQYRDRSNDRRNKGAIVSMIASDNSFLREVSLQEEVACDGGLSWASCCARPSVNDDGGFTEVSYKKAVKAPVQQKVVQVVRGKKKTTSGDAVISGVPRRLSTFVGRLHIDTTEDDLSKFLNDAGLDVVKCKRLKPKDDQQFSTAAFFVSCPSAYKELFYNEDTWPEGCELRDWYFKTGSQTS